MYKAEDLAKISNCSEYDTFAKNLAYQHITSGMVGAAKKGYTSFVYNIQSYEKIRTYEDVLDMLRELGYRGSIEFANGQSFLKVYWNHYE